MNGASRFEWADHTQTTTSPTGNRRLRHYYKPTKQQKESSDRAAPYLGFVHPFVRRLGPLVEKLPKSLALLFIWFDVEPQYWVTTKLHPPSIKTKPPSGQEAVPATNSLSSLSVSGPSAPFTQCFCLTWHLPYRSISIRQGNGPLRREFTSSGSRMREAGSQRQPLLSRQTMLSPSPAAPDAPWSLLRHFSPGS